MLFGAAKACGCRLHLRHHATLLDTLGRRHEAHLASPEADGYDRTRNPALPFIPSVDANVEFATPHVRTPGERAPARCRYSRGSGLR